MWTNPRRLVNQHLSAQNSSIIAQPHIPPLLAHMKNPARDAGSYQHSGIIDMLVGTVCLFIEPFAWFPGQNALSMDRYNIQPMQDSRNLRCRRIS